MNSIVVIVAIAAGLLAVAQSTAPADSIAASHDLDWPAVVRTSEVLTCNVSGCYNIVTTNKLIEPKWSGERP